MTQTQPKPNQTDLKTKLAELEKKMGAWEKKPIFQSGNVIVELIKLPARTTKRGSTPERLAIQVRLVDAFRGVIIENSRELEDLINLIEAKKEKLLAIAKALDEIHGFMPIAEESIEL